MSQVIEPSNVSSEFPHASFVSHPHLKRSVVLPLEHAESTLSFAFPHAHIQNGFAAEPTDRKGINLSPEVQSRDQPTEGNTQALPQGPDAASNIPVTTSKAVSGAFSTLRWLLRFIFAPFVRAVDAVSRSERPGNIEHGILFALLDMLRRKGQGSMYTVVNTTTLGYLADLLRMDDYATIPTRTTGSDTFNLLQFIIHVRETGSLDQAGLPNAERKMLYLIIELGTIAEVISKSLQFDLSDLTAENLELVASGASADVFAGVCRGDRIALKRFRKFAQHQKDFCREVFTWQALKHEYVLPFVGVNFRQSEPLTIVSPFMENGTLISWRNKTKPAVYDIDERILEVAGGLRYLHSEGIVHGDLRGNNILLDSNMHVKIADFGSSRHSDARPSEFRSSYQFSASELFPDESGQYLVKLTEKTDVYSFGCLYYEILTGDRPFGRASEYRVIRSIKAGKRPTRMAEPAMGNRAWKLISRCWNQDPDKRPNMQQIVSIMSSWHSKPVVTE